MYVGELLGFCGQRRVCVMCLQDRVCVLLITHPVTNLLLEPVASHSAVVLINRLGHCAQAEPRSLPCLCVHMPVCDVVCVLWVFVVFTCTPHLSLIEAGFIIASWSFSQTKPRNITECWENTQDQLTVCSFSSSFFFLCLSLSLSSSLPKLAMEYVTVPGLVSWCICPITQGFKAASHVVMPHRKAPLLSCALCLNKHLSKHLDNHFSLCLNTHTYT